MKKTFLVAAATATLFGSGAANAAAFLTSAEVQGLTSNPATVWNTKNTGNYTLFVQQPTPGAYLNKSNTDALNVASTEGINKFFLAGDGYYTNNKANSDLSYKLTLGFSDGTQLTGDYSFLTNEFTNGTTVNNKGVTYALTSFSFTRTQGNSVSINSAKPGDNAYDYAGNFNYNVSTAPVAAVPEPATWAMMMVGFGMIGFGLRRRSKVTTSVRFA